MTKFFGRQPLPPRQLPKRVPERTGEKYYICVPQWGRVLFSVEITGRRNMERVWQYLLEEGRFADANGASEHYPFSLRGFLRTKVDLKPLVKRYIAQEPETLKAAFEQLAQAFS